MNETEPLTARIKHAWNAFQNKDPTTQYRYHDIGPGSSSRPDRARLRTTTERSTIISVYNRIALDVSEIMIQHVRKDQNGRYEETIDSGLNYILTTEANIDQTSKAFIQDIVMSMFDEGCIALVPVDTTIDPKVSGSYEINSLRTGKILEWFPQHIQVEVYNDKTGTREKLMLPKSTVAIINNPLYSVMNESNSTLKRLVRKLNLLDSVDEQSGSGKLDLIIQLPYVVKSEARRVQANERRKDIEMQLSGSKYGIAYTDGTERITQLNRATENNLAAQVEYLTAMLHSQLGVTEEISNGTADEVTMLNYNNRTVVPIVSAIIDEMNRKFLTKTARTQGQAIMAFKDPFKLVAVGALADIADKFTRNEILSSNEVRALIGYKPSKEASADELRNKNLNAQTPGSTEGGEISQNGITGEQAMTLFEELLNNLESDIDSVIESGGENESE